VNFHNVLVETQRCVAVCCSVLQCVVVYCSVLQCVAVCCSVNFGNVIVETLRNRFSKVCLLDGGFVSKKYRAIKKKYFQSCVAVCCDEVCCSELQ